MIFKIFKYIKLIFGGNTVPLKFFMHDPAIAKNVDIQIEWYWVIFMTFYGVSNYIT